VKLCDAPSVVVLGDKLLYHLVCDMAVSPKNSTVAKRIRYYRRKAGLYTHELAEQAEISRHAVMDYESGTSEPPLELLNKIADVCKVSADRLYDEYYAFLAYPYSIKLKEIRKANMLYQYDLSKLLSIGTSAVADWEQGRTVIKRKTWERLVELGLL
jgi:transcriptional regulator with XRE-family HTH domain